MQKSQPIIVVTIMTMAVITAVGMFLAWSYLKRRPDLPEGGYTAVVQDAPVTIYLDPALEVRLVNPPPPPTELTGDEPPTEPLPDPMAPDQTTPTAEPEPTATPIPDSVIYETYVVQPNDSLYSIAERVDVSIALMAHYDIAQDSLVPGETIELPKGNPAYCPGHRPYAVGEGDTAYSISRQFDTTVENLQTINRLDEDFTVRVAEIICVP